MLDALRGAADLPADEFQPEFQPARLGELERSSLDISRARDELGFTADTSLADGMHAVLATALMRRPGRRTRALEARVAELERTIAQLREAGDGAYGHLEAHKQRIADLEGHRAIEAPALVTAGGDIQKLSVVAQELLARVARTEDVAAMTALIDGLPPSATRISVITPTFERPEQLRESVASVLAQRHTAFELLVIDDAADGSAQAALAGVEDPRLRVLHREGEGSSSAARNTGLAAATGDVIAYVDDDNLMGSLWLRAVAWAFDEHPDLNVAYGALVADHEHVGTPWLSLPAWDREQMAHENLIDNNVLAHRAGLAEAYFLTDVEAGSDWEMTERLTSVDEPMRLPILATVYRTRGPDRVTTAPDAPAATADVHRRILARRAAAGE